MDQSKKRYYLVGQTSSIQSMSIKFSPKTQIRVLTRWYKIQPQTIESTRLRLGPNIDCKEFTHSAHYLKHFEIQCFLWFFYWRSTCVSSFISRTWSLWWPQPGQTRDSVARGDEGGMFIDFDPPGESDVRWTRGCDLNPDIETTWRHKPYSRQPPSFIYKVFVHSLPVTFRWQRLDNYFHRKSLWQWSNGQINILIAACNNQPMRRPQVWRLTNEKPRDKWHVLTRDMDTSRVMEVFWPRAWCIQCVGWHFPSLWLAHFYIPSFWLAAGWQVFWNLLTSTSRALWSHKARQSRWLSVIRSSWETK